MEDVLETEEKLNIVCNKYSPVHTWLGQAANFSHMFKTPRNNVKSMPTENISISPITSRLLKMIDDMSSKEKDTSHTNVVNLYRSKR